MLSIVYFPLYVNIPDVNIFDDIPEDYPLGIYLYHITILIDFSITFIFPGIYRVRSDFTHRKLYSGIQGSGTKGLKLQFHNCISDLPSLIYPIVFLRRSRIWRQKNLHSKEFAADFDFTWTFHKESHSFRVNLYPPPCYSDYSKSWRRHSGDGRLFSGIITVFICLPRMPRIFLMKTLKECLSKSTSKTRHKNTINSWITRRVDAPSQNVCFLKQIYA